MWFKLLLTKRSAFCGAAPVSLWGEDRVHRPLMNESTISRVGGEKVVIMSVDELRLALAEVLSRPLTSLVVAADRAEAGAEEVAGWSLPEAGREVLLRCGLPLIEENRMVPHIQEEGVPQLIGSRGEAYGLGLWGNYEIGALAGSGEVRGLPLPEDFPEVFVNSSVEKYVETMWRWYATWQIIIPVLSDGRAQQYLLEDFLAFAVQLDPAVESSLWSGFIRGW
ncbi:SUKH-4 family immunity protein [Lentzea sp. NPDC058436]|uniref:SUKH-4 family immunity protein n=1 Tax=Lentzea sp. NPDC058436 TaxID=3346499 RepID=UPI003663A101